MTSIGETYGFDGKGRWAHGGMLQAAINIRKELETNRILKNINTPNRTMTPNLQTPLTEVKLFSTIDRVPLTFLRTILH